MIKNSTLYYRSNYVQKLIDWSSSSDLVKIVTGIRRCGKSKLLELFANYLLEEKHVSQDQILCINLEDYEEVRNLGLKLNDNGLMEDYESLLDLILKKITPSKMNYVFIDEIQLLKHWQQVANTLRLRENIDLYLTGSNAYMFATELSNFFGGRYIEIKLQPYSFFEFREACDFIQKQSTKTNKTPGSILPKDLNDLYLKYVQNSGFPQPIHSAWNKQMIYDYLKDVVYSNNVQKDIIQRFNVKNPRILEHIILFLFDNIGNSTSLRGIERVLKTDGIKTSTNDISKYVKGLLDSYLLYECKRYDIKGKSLLSTNSKFYVADLGLRNAVLIDKKNTDDLGHILENIVYLELLRRGYTVRYGQIFKYVTNTEGKKEKKSIQIDFVAQKNGSIEYYQVSYILDSSETIQRELSPLLEIKDNYPKYILSMDIGNETIKGVERLNVLSWLNTNPPT